ncbi:MAG TPA: secretin N-terminal domain-containing protein [Thermoanaerobaculia bacterium]|nr:secretin N-terminal domain-containing protein [Thermoanaerobaculia bacterium]
MKQIGVFVVLILAASSLWAASQNLSVRAFQFRHKQADRAAAVIKPLISAEGSLSIQPGSNTLVITDHGENLKSIAMAIAAFDVPSRNLKLQVRIIAASRQPKAQPAAADLDDIAKKLAVLRYNVFEQVGELTVEGREGDPVVADIDQLYRAELKFGEFDPLSNTVRISDFQLSRIQGDKSAAELVPLLKSTSLNLKLGHTLMLGAAQLPDSPKALMLVLVAQPAN